MATEVVPKVSRNRGISSGTRDRPPDGNWEGSSEKNASTSVAKGLWELRGVETSFDGTKHSRFTGVYRRGSDRVSGDPQHLQSGCGGTVGRSVRTDWNRKIYTYISASTPVVR